VTYERSVVWSANDIEHHDITKIVLTAMNWIGNSCLATGQQRSRRTYYCFKKSLKILKGQSESYIEEEQTTQWPKEKYKRTNNDLQNLNIKLKIE
jgi:hypothetical protein